MTDGTGHSADGDDGSCDTPLKRNQLLLMSGLASGRAAGAGKEESGDAALAWRISRGLKGGTLGSAGLLPGLGMARDLPAPAGSTQGRCRPKLLEV